MTLVSESSCTFNFCTCSCVIDSSKLYAIIICCADVREEGYRSPLHLACVRGHKGVVKYLVEKANCDVSE